MEGESQYKYTLLASRIKINERQKSEVSLDDSYY